MDGQKKKIFVLGLDGATWELLNPLMDDGVMPNLNKVVSGGTSGVLRSTIPPYTAPAWVTCTTGVNPGKHGIFGFTIKNNGVAGGKFIDSTRIRVPTLWHWISGVGKTVGLINVPITYPAESVNGFVVPCFMTPLGKKDYTYPVSIFKDFLIPLDYVINVRIAEIQNFSEDILIKTISDIRYMVQKRYHLMEELRKVYNPDFFMIVFTCLDKIQHKFWKYLDSRDRMYTTSSAQKSRPVILSVYRQMDSIIGKIIDESDDDTTLYIVSDHGFGPHKKNFFINKWLVSNSFLKFRKTSLLKQRFFQMYIGKPDFSTRNIDIFNNPIHQCINWDKSWFVGSDPYEQGVYYVNNDFEPQYSNRVSKLIQKLGELKDPETGRYLFDQIYHRDELYTGDYTRDAPDVVLKMKDYGYTLTRGYSRKSKIFHRVEKPTGSHRPDGIFVAYGKDILPGKKIDASIQDIAPTVLYEMGLSVYEGMDGKVLKEIFLPKFQSSHVINYVDGGYLPRKISTEDTKYSAEEKEEIIGRLRDLGYLD